MAKGLIEEEAIVGSHAVSAFVPGHAEETTANHSAVVIVQVHQQGIAINNGLMLHFPRERGTRDPTSYLEVQFPKLIPEGGVCFGHDARLPHAHSRGDQRLVTLSKASFDCLDFH